MAIVGDSVKSFLCIIFFTALSVVVVGLGCAGSASDDAGLQATTLKLQQAIQRELDTMDRDLSSAAGRLSQTGLSRAEAEQILDELCHNRSYVVDCCTVDSAGKMVTVAPAAYRQYEGSDISQQEHVVKLHRTKQAVLSQVFTAVEGLDAVDLEWPIMSGTNDLIGSASMLIKLEALFDAIIKLEMKDSGVEVWAMQLDGLIVYDFDTTEIGRNLFQDPLYQPYSQLLSLGSKIITQDSGAGSYEFLSAGMGQPVKKQAYWASMGLHGTSWRIVSVRVIASSALFSRLA